MWKRAALQRGDPFGDELRAAVDQARLLGAVLQRAARDVVVVGLVGLAEVRGVGVGDRALAAHPVQRGARVEAAGKRDADLLAGGKTLENCAHGFSQYPMTVPIAPRGPPLGFRAVMYR